MSSLSNWRIGKRLSIGFGVVILLLVVISVASMWAQSALNDESNATYRSETRGTSRRLGES